MRSMADAVAWRLVAAIATAWFRCTPAWQQPAEGKGEEGDVADDGALHGAAARGIHGATQTPLSPAVIRNAACWLARHADDATDADVEQWNEELLACRTDMPLPRLRGTASPDEDRAAAAVAVDLQCILRGGLLEGVRGTVVVRTLQHLLRAITRMLADQGIELQHVKGVSMTPAADGAVQCLVLLHADALHGEEAAPPVDSTTPWTARPAGAPSVVRATARPALDNTLVYPETIVELSAGGMQACGGELSVQTAANAALELLDAMAAVPSSAREPKDFHRLYRVLAQVATFVVPQVSQWIPREALWDCMYAASAGQVRLRRLHTGGIQIGPAADNVRKARAVSDAVGTPVTEDMALVVCPPAAPCDLSPAVMFRLYCGMEETPADGDAGGTARRWFLGIKPPLLVALPPREAAACIDHRGQAVGHALQHIMQTRAAWFGPAAHAAGPEAASANSQDSQQPQPQPQPQCGVHVVWQLVRWRYRGPYGAAVPEPLLQV